MKADEKEGEKRERERERETKGRKREGERERASLLGQPGIYYIFLEEMCFQLAFELFKLIGS